MHGEAAIVEALLRAGAATDLVDEKGPGLGGGGSPQREMDLLEEFGTLDLLDYFDVRSWFSQFLGFFCVL